MASAARNQVKDSERQARRAMETFIDSVVNVIEKTPDVKAHKRAESRKSTNDRAVPRAKRRRTA